MENSSYNSYPESGNSSPRSREIDFENPPVWEDSQPVPNYKVKFMCSYGGKIHPRPHDNQLAYVGGETKILAVDRFIKFANLVGKLSAIADQTEVCFKYQLPGEDLDALISVTSDDDLEHMMHEYDRLYRASAKPARLRLFLFPAPAATPSQSVDSVENKLDRERFVEALNTGPIHAPAVVPPSKVDFLFNLEKEMPPPIPPVVTRIRDPIVEPAFPEPKIVVPNIEDRVIGSDPIQKHIQDLQRMRISEEQQALFRRKSDDSFDREYYVQKMPEKVSPSTLPPQSMPVQANYWHEKQVPGGVYPTNSLGSDQQVYMIPSQANMYQMGRPVTGPSGQGYYAMQRMPPEVYREQAMYNVVTQAQPPAQHTLPQQAGNQTAAYPVSTSGVGVMDTGYRQVAYDSPGGRQVAYDSPGGRQVFYTAPGGVVSQQQAPIPAQYQAMSAAGYNTDMRAVAGNYSQEAGGKVVVKASQTSG